MRVESLILKAQLSFKTLSCFLVCFCLHWKANVYYNAIRCLHQIRLETSKQTKTKNKQVTEQIECLAAQLTLFKYLNCVDLWMHCKSCQSSKASS